MVLLLFLYSNFNNLVKVSFDGFTKLIFLVQILVFYTFDCQIIVVFLFEDIDNSVNFPLIRNPAILFEFEIDHVDIGFDFGFDFKLFYLRVPFIHFYVRLKNIVQTL